MAERRTRTLKTDFLARVEGEGAMIVKIKDGRVDEVKLNIYEPPRFFEAFLRGRRHTEPPDITARICGICPVAYQISACAAIEDACGVSVTDEIRLIERLLRRPAARRAGNQHRRPEGGKRTPPPGSSPWLRVRRPRPAAAGWEAGAAARSRPRRSPRRKSPGVDETSSAC